MLAWSLILFSRLCHIYNPSFEATLKLRNIAALLQVHQPAIILNQSFTIPNVTTGSLLVVAIPWIIFVSLPCVDYRIKRAICELVCLLFQQLEKLSLQIHLLIASNIHCSMVSSQQQEGIVSGSFEIRFAFSVIKVSYWTMMRCKCEEWLFAKALLAKSTGDLVYSDSRSSHPLMSTQLNFFYDVF